MIIRLALGVVLLCSCPSFAEEHDRDSPKEKEPGKAEPQDLLYALGAILGHKLAPSQFSDREMKIVAQGFSDAALRRKLRLDDPDLDEWGPKVNQMLARRTSPVVTAERERAARFVEAEARKKGARRLATDIVIEVRTPANGRQPTAESRVKVSYVAHLADETIFDSSRQHGGAAEFGLDGVVPCLRKSLEQMHVGETARIVCGPDASYGNAGQPPKVPGGAAVVYELELLAVTP